MIPFENVKLTEATHSVAVIRQTLKHKQQMSKAPDGGDSHLCSLQSNRRFLYQRVSQQSWSHMIDGEGGECKDQESRGAMLQQPEEKKEECFWF